MLVVNQVAQVKVEKQFILAFTDLVTKQSQFIGLKEEFGRLYEYIDENFDEGASYYSEFYHDLDSDKFFEWYDLEELSEKIDEIRCTLRSLKLDNQWKNSSPSDWQEHGLCCNELL